MTPTLIGRWQTRTFLMWTFGLLVTLGFGMYFNDMATPLALLGYVYLIGMVGDFLYNAVQNMRWDYDYPPFMHVITGILEGAVIWILVQLVDLPFVAPNLSLQNFLLHYCTVFAVIFAVVWGPMKIMFVQWRYRGGRIV